LIKTTAKLKKDLLFWFDLIRFPIIDLWFIYTNEK